MIYSFYILSQTLYSQGCCPLYEAVAGKALFESSSRNSRLAACIILPEICSRGFSLRPLFDASLERIEATRQKLPRPSLSRLGKTASNLQDYACGQGFPRECLYIYMYAWKLGLSYFDYNRASKGSLWTPIVKLHKSSAKMWCNPNFFLHNDFVFILWCTHPNVEFNALSLNFAF